MKIAVFQWFRCFVGSPPFGASSWPLGLLLASCWPLASDWPLAGLLLASCWPFAGLLLATSFPTKISLENRFFRRLAKLVNSLHENGCFSMVSVFRGVPPIWGLFLASWPLAGLLLASCWPLAGLWPLVGLLLASGFLLAFAGLLLASCWPLASDWPLAGLLLASCWPLAGHLLATSLENRFFTRLAKLVNSLHENGWFFNGFGVSWGPLPLGHFPGLLLASWPLAGLLLASCWLLAGLLLAFCWPLAGYKLPHEDFSRKSVFHKARKIGEFSS